MKDFTLPDLIDIEILQKLQDSFAKYTGMAALTVDQTGAPLTKGSSFTTFCTQLVRQNMAGMKRCETCDRNGALMTLKKGKPAVYICHAGLIEYAAPIIVEGKFLGSFIGGQVRPDFLDEDKLKAYAKELGLDEDQYIAEIKRTKSKTKNEVIGAAVFLSSLATSLSEMALKSHNALRRSQNLEMSAQSKADYVTEMTSKIKSSMQEWTDVIIEAIQQNDVEKIKNSMQAVLDKGNAVFSSVDDSLNYIHITEGKSTLIETEYSPANIINTLRKTINSQISVSGNSDIKIESEISPELPDLMFGDYSRITQLMTSITQSILAHTTKGTIKITVKPQKKMYATNLIIDITDPHDKMSDEDATTLSNYFNTGNEKLLQTKALSSSGYAMINSLVKQMFGAIELTSDDDGNDYFSIRIPQLEVQVEELGS